MTSTRLARPRSLPTSSSAWSAVPAEIGTTAACSKERFAGLRASLSSRADGVLGERARGDAVHLVADREPRHRRRRPPRRCRRRRGRAPGSSGGAGPWPGARRRACRSSGARCRGPGRRRARAPAPRASPTVGRWHSAEPEDVGAAVAVLDDGSHAWRSGWALVALAGASWRSVRRGARIGVSGSYLVLTLPYIVRNVQGVDAIQEAPWLTSRRWRADAGAAEP